MGVHGADAGVHVHGMNVGAGVYGADVRGVYMVLM